MNVILATCNVCEFQWRKDNDVPEACLRCELERFRRDYALFEEASPPDVPRAQFVKWCFEAWEKQCQQGSGQ